MHNSVIGTEKLIKVCLGEKKKKKKKGTVKYLQR